MQSSRSSRSPERARSRSPVRKAASTAHKNPYASLYARSRPAETAQPATASIHSSAHGPSPTLPPPASSSAAAAPAAAAPLLQSSADTVVQHSAPSAGGTQFAFYIQHPAVTVRSEEEVEAYRKQHQVNTQGQGVPRPVTSFEEASFPAYVLAELTKAGFPAPTPIQAQAWPMALMGRDLIGLAETGSGKTLAYLLPAIVHINAQPYLQPGDGPIVLVLAPTRELALQIQQECTRFGSSSRVKNTVLYGGVPKSSQAAELRAGAEIVIATPGRLNDMLDSRLTNLGRVTYLVLDEADRMLDMGFEPQIKKILGQVRRERQTLLWSATWPQEVAAIAADMLRTPLKVTIGSAALTANHNITQVVKMVAEADKYKHLIRVLGKEMDGSRILIFAATKAVCDELTVRLRKDGFPALGMHGDKEQLEREWVLAEFKAGRHPIMIATDVAGRGLDVKDIKVVVNYDMANSLEAYIHRIGRTGRAGASGRAYTLFTAGNARMAAALVGVLAEAKQAVPPELSQMAAVAQGIQPDFIKALGSAAGSRG
ncbi:P-loop containing nucleoside triphosphate hydrolase protein [Haematococcus lacustris]